MVMLFNWKKKIGFKSTDDNPQTLNPVYEDIQSVQHSSLQVSRNVTCGEIDNYIIKILLLTSKIVYFCTMINVISNVRIDELNDNFFKLIIVTY